MKNETRMHTMRGPSSEAKEHTARCPFPDCKFTIKLRRVDTANDVSGLLNISRVRWESTDSAPGEWEVLFESHVREHDVAEIVKVLQNYQDRVMNADETARNLNKFLDDLAIAANQSASNAKFESVVRNVVAYSDREYGFIPEQFASYAK